MALISQDWLPHCAMKRIICHWTAGAHKASSLDRAHYHILIEQDGTLVRGTHSIEDNVSTNDGRYAAHTLRLNTGSIGLAVCCMANAQEKPFDPGPFPMTQKQWQTMAQVAAELCQFYSISVTPQTVLGHGEVERLLGVDQASKWDPMVLPWDPDTSPTEVGNAFRSLVQQCIDRGFGQDEVTLPDIHVVIAGKAIAGGVVANESSYVKVAPLVDDLQWSLLNAAVDFLVLGATQRDEPLYVPYVLLGTSEGLSDDMPEGDIVSKVMEHGYVEARALASELEVPISWDEEIRTITIGDVPMASSIPAAGGAPTPYTIKPGETLSAIAARLLGNGSRWREILKVDGTPFSEAEARRLQPGTVVFIPSESGATTQPVRPTMVSTVDIDALCEVAPSSLRTFARNSIPVILAECQQSGVTDPAQIAYVLATAQHESLCGKFTTELWGPTASQRRYEGRRDLGNTQPGDGFRFRGRGYVQVTGRANYRTWSQRLNVDLERDPDIVSKHPDIAAQILVQGMRDGSFRASHTLGRYIPRDHPNFFDAREIINADKRIVDRNESKSRGERIADIAEAYLAGVSG